MMFKVRRNTWSNQRAKKRRQKQLNEGKEISPIGTEEPDRCTQIDIVFYLHLQVDLLDNSVLIKLSFWSNEIQYDSQQPTYPQVKEYLNQILQFLKNKTGNR